MTSGELTNKYRLAFDISPVPLLLVAASGEIILANDGFLALFEYTSEDLIGKNVEILVPEDTRDHHPELRKAFHRVPSKRSMGAGRDLFGVTKYKKIIPLELGIQPVPDGDQQLAMISAIDIKQRKVNEMRVQQAMDAAASAMVMVDQRGTIVFVNRAASVLFGYEERELVGQRVEIIVPEEFRRAHLVYTNGFMSASRSRAMGADRNVYARRNDGTPIPVEITLTPVDSTEGEMVMSTITDLSERVAAAEALAEKNKALETLNVELSHFAYSASHDLKAPLSSITGLIALCIEDLNEGNTDELQRNMEKVMSISRRSAEKVEGILRIARAGRDALPLEAVSLEKLIGEVWTDLTGGGANTMLELDISNVDTVVIEVMTLRVILENLISNALKYRKCEGTAHTVEVRCRIVEENLEISVSDNGVGISPENTEKVFAMFTRLDERSGDGLGLTLVKKQIDRLGGKITLESEDGVGTSVFVFLPLAGAQEDNTSVPRDE